MNLQSKITYARQAIEFIARHDDADAAVRNAALDKIIQLVEHERAQIAERVQKKIDAAVA